MKFKNIIIFFTLVLISFSYAQEGFFGKRPAEYIQQPEAKRQAFQVPGQFVPGRQLIQPTTAAAAQSSRPTTSTAQQPTRFPSSSSQFRSPTYYGPSSTTAMPSNISGQQPMQSTTAAAAQSSRPVASSSAQPTRCPHSLVIPFGLSANQLSEFQKNEIFSYVKALTGIDIKSRQKVGQDFRQPKINYINNISNIDSLNSYLKRIFAYNEIEKARIQKQQELLKNENEALEFNKEYLKNLKKEVIQLSKEKFEQLKKKQEQELLENIERSKTPDIEMQQIEVPASAPSGQPVPVVSSLEFSSAQMLPISPARNLGNLEENEEEEIVEAEGIVPAPVSPAESGVVNLASFAMAASNVAQQRSNLKGPDFEDPRLYNLIISKKIPGIKINKELRTLDPNIKDRIRNMTPIQNALQYLIDNPNLTSGHRYRIKSHIRDVLLNNPKLEVNLNDYINLINKIPNNRTKTNYMKLFKNLCENTDKCNISPDSLSLLNKAIAESPDEETSSDESESDSDDDIPLLPTTTAAAALSTHTAASSIDLPGPMEIED